MKRSRASRQNILSIDLWLYRTHRSISRIWSNTGTTKADEWTNRRRGNWILSNQAAKNNYYVICVLNLTLDTIKLSFHDWFKICFIAHSQLYYTLSVGILNQWKLLSKLDRESMVSSLFYLSCALRSKHDKCHFWDESVTSAVRDLTETMNGTRKV